MNKRLYVGYVFHSEGKAADTREGLRQLAKLLNCEEWEVLHRVAQYLPLLIQEIDEFEESIRQPTVVFDQRRQLPKFNQIIETIKEIKNGSVR